MAKPALRSLPRTTLFVPDEDSWANAKARSERLGYGSVSHYIFELLRLDAQREIVERSLVRQLEKYYEWEHVSLGAVAGASKVPLPYIARFMEQHRLPATHSREASRTLHVWMAERGMLPREVGCLVSLNELFKRTEQPTLRESLVSLFPEEQDRTNEVLWVARRLSADEKVVRDLRASALAEASEVELAFARLGLLYEAEILSDDPLVQNLAPNTATLMPALLMAASTLVVLREVGYMRDLDIGPLRLADEPLRKVFECVRGYRKVLQKSIPSLMDAPEVTTTLAAYVGAGRAH